MSEKSIRELENEIKQLRIKEKLNPLQKQLEEAKKRIGNVYSTHKLSILKTLLNYPKDKIKTISQSLEIGLSKVLDCYISHRWSNNPLTDDEIERIDENTELTVIYKLETVFVKISDTGKMSASIDNVYCDYCNPNMYTKYKQNEHTFENYKKIVENKMYELVAISTDYLKTEHKIHTNYMTDEFNDQKIEAFKSLGYAIIDLTSRETYLLGGNPFIIRDKIVVNNDCVKLLEDKRKQCRQLICGSQYIEYCGYVDVCEKEREIVTLCDKLIAKMKEMLCYN